MKITQLSIQLDDEPGHLCAMSELLGEEGINIRAVSAVLSPKGSLVHIVADNPAKAAELLGASGYKFEESQVIAVETPDHPGGMNAVMRPLARAGIHIRYFYPMIGSILQNAVMILGVDDLDGAIKALKKEYINILVARPVSGGK